MGLKQEKLKKQKQRFDYQLGNYKRGPIKIRECQNCVCLFFFITLIISFIILGVYFLCAGGNNLSDLKSVFGNSNTTSPQSIFSRNIGKIVRMISLSIGLTIVFLILFIVFSTQVIYLSIICSYLIIGGLLALSIVFSQYISLAIAIIFLIYQPIMTYCYRQRIKDGIVLLKVTGIFIKQNLKILLIGALSLFLSFAILLFSTACWLSGFIQLKIGPHNSFQTTPNLNQYYSNLVMIIILWSLAIFVLIFFYYVMVFVIASAVSNWYYGDDKKSIFSGYKLVRYNLGPIGFVSFMISLAIIPKSIGLGSFMMQSNSNNNSNFLDKVDNAGDFLDCIKEILDCQCKKSLQVLNSNSVIVMALTGQDFNNSSQSALGLIFQNVELFNVKQFIVTTIQTYSYIVCLLFPSCLGGYLIVKQQNDSNNALIGGIIIYMLSWICSFVVLGFLNEILSSVLIFYCLDYKLKSQGFNFNRISTDIKDIFEQKQKKNNQANNNIGTQMRLSNEIPRDQQIQVPIQQNQDNLNQTPASQSELNQQSNQQNCCFCLSSI